MGNRITVRLDEHTTQVISELSQKHKASKSLVVRAILKKSIRDDIVNNEGYLKSTYNPREE